MMKTQSQTMTHSHSAAWLQSFIFVLFAFQSRDLLADTIDTSGQEPYEQCGYCHEFDGNSRMPSYPKLASQEAGYLIKQLKDFRNGVRKGSMQATAELLTDEDIHVVAEYFSSQSLTNKAPEHVPEIKDARAKQLASEGDAKRQLQACNQCHGLRGKGNGLIPRLAGQHQDYLYKQLQLFKSGQRKNDVNAQMRQVAEKLEMHELRALAQWFASLPDAVVSP